MNLNSEETENSIYFLLDQVESIKKASRSTRKATRHNRRKLQGAVQNNREVSEKE